MSFPRIPELRVADPQWFQDLKRWCGDVVRALQLVTVKGDERTVRVSGGIVSLLDLDPKPFEVRISDSAAVRVYSGTWTRNGHACALTVDEGEDFATLGSLTSGPYYITLTLSYDGSGHDALTPNTLEVTAETSAPADDETNVKMVIAVVNTYPTSIIQSVNQLWTGNIDDTYTMPDSYDDGELAITAASLNYDAVGALQLYGWATAAGVGTGYIDVAADLIPFQDVDELGPPAKPAKYITPTDLVSDVLEYGLDVGEYLTDGYTSAAEHNIPLAAGGFVAVRFEYGRAFLFAT